jgi:hypothetical protein
VSIPLDLALPAGADPGALNFHSRCLLFVRSCQRLLPRRDPHHSAFIVGLVLPDAHHYSLDFIPAKRQWIFKLNPLIYVINGFRLSVYYGQLPRAQSIAASFACALITLFLGFALFRHYQDDFVFYV